MGFRRGKRRFSRMVGRGFRRTRRTFKRRGIRRGNFRRRGRTGLRQLARANRNTRKLALGEIKYQFFGPDIQAAFNQSGHANHTFAQLDPYNAWRLTAPTQGTGLSNNVIGESFRIKNIWIQVNVKGRRENSYERNVSSAAAIADGYRHEYQFFAVLNPGRFNADAPGTSTGDWRFYVDSEVSPADATALWRTPNTPSDTADYLHWLRVRRPLVTKRNSRIPRPKIIWASKKFGYTPRWIPYGTQIDGTTDDTAWGASNFYNRNHVFKVRLPSWLKNSIQLERDTNGIATEIQQNIWICARTNAATEDSGFNYQFTEAMCYYTYYDP